MNRLNWLNIHKETCYLELVNTAGNTLRLTTVFDERGFCHYLTDTGNRWTSSMVEEAMKATDLAEVRVHDGIHTSGECIFVCNNISVTARFI